MINTYKWITIFGRQKNLILAEIITTMRSINIKHKWLLEICQNKVSSVPQKFIFLPWNQNQQIWSSIASLNYLGVPANSIRNIYGHHPGHVSFISTAKIHKQNQKPPKIWKVDLDCLKKVNMMMTTETSYSRDRHTWVVGRYPGWPARPWLYTNIASSAFCTWWSSEANKFVRIDDNLYF